MTEKRPRNKGDRLQPGRARTDNQIKAAVKVAFAKEELDAAFEHGEKYVPLSLKGKKHKTPKLPNVSQRELNALSKKFDASKKPTLAEFTSMSAQIFKPDRLKLSPTEFYKKYAPQGMGEEEFHALFDKWLPDTKRKTKIIHVNQLIIRSNAKRGENNPPLTVRTGKNGKSTTAHEVVIHGPSRVIHSPHKPLSCGARVWIETESEVELIGG